MPHIDSRSVGNPECFRDLEDLICMLEALPPGNRDHGRVSLLMRRSTGGRRETLAKAMLEPQAGVPGDAWARDEKRRDDMQIAVMELAVAELIANGQPLLLFGDCLILDLDLSAANLPVLTRLRVGDATLEVTPMPHNGCQKFRSRFGDGALRLVSMRRLRHRNLRGIYMRVIEAGEVKIDDLVEVMFRPPVSKQVADIKSAPAASLGLD
jgi:hypothetical protein